MRLASKHFWAGVLFIAFGLAFLIGSTHYHMGTALRMGPAYFPTVVAGLLTVLGFLLVLQAFFVSSEPVPRLHWRPVVLVVVGVCLFGALLRPLGMVGASAVLIVVGAAAGHEFNWKEVLILCAVLVAFAVGVFAYGLGLPFDLWPEG